MARLPVFSDTAFQFEGRNVRLVEVDGETWFVATDIARELGYGLASDLLKNLDADEKGMCPAHTLGGEQSLSIISEAGVYRAIVQRKLNKKQHDHSLFEKVSRFQRFVFHDVLPSIRRTGSYNAPAPAFAVPATFAEALRLAADQAERISQQQAAIDDMTPKALFHDDVVNAVNCQDMMAVAKVLGTGRTRLFAKLRLHGLLMPNNVPYQQYIDGGYFKVVERTWRDQQDQPHTTTKTLVTGKGLTYIQKLYAKSQPGAVVATVSRAMTEH